MKTNILKSLFPAFLLFLALSFTANAETVTDSSGTTITFDTPFSRIISLYPAHTENLYSLGLDKEIIGVSTGADYPEQTAGKARFHYREDPEKFMAARPDLVLIRPMILRGYPDFIEKLRLAGIVILSLQPSSIDEMYEYWQILGRLTGKQAAAQNMIDKFKGELAQIKNIADTIPVDQKKRVYFQSIHKKMKTFAPSSMAIFVLTSAGGINIASDATQVRNTNIAAYSKEKILSHADQIDLFLAQTGRMNPVNTDILYEEPGFQAIKAMKNQAVFTIDETIVSRPTMRLLEGTREIQKILYPQLVN